jgi:lipopolysaccharide transport system ATP-binding protein
MNNDIAIKVENLTKTYRLYDNHSDRVKEAFHPLRKKYHHNFNALSNIDFEVRKGETLGIIGRNGSGKSTLLQIVCGILQPTSGSIQVDGRVSALLELGMGFNPEFTGLQNLYINASILGLSQKEINESFDDIAAFADIGDFINQPVKSYSSGMVVRLGFAVAISIKPDILVVDEALAVGDEAFQRKCYARIKQIQDEGCTILFVSHGAGIVVELCNRALMLDQGELLIAGAPKQVISRYHKMIFAHQESLVELKKEWRQDPNRFDLAWDEIQDEENECKTDNGVQIINKEKKESSQQPFYAPEMVPKSTIYYEKHGAIIENSHITTLDGRKVNMLVSGEEYIFTYKVYFEQPAFKVRFGMLIKTISGLELAGGISAPFGKGIDFIEPGTTYTVSFNFNCNLNSGTYFLNSGVVGLQDSNQFFLDRVIDITMFKVQENNFSISNSIVDLINSVDVKILNSSKDPSIKK